MGIHSKAAIQSVEAKSATYPSLRDKKIIITGGASGIGAAFVEAFCAQGAKVAFVDVATEAGNDLASNLATTSEHAPMFKHCDLTDMASLDAVFGELADGLGGIDVLINNAANDDRHIVTDVTPEYWDQRIAVNLRHLFFTSKFAVPFMRAAGGGSIINMGSISWHVALAELAIYQTAKAGIEGMSRAMARDFGVDKIRVNVIVPGAIRTPRQDALWQTDDSLIELLGNQCLKERIMPHDVAALALFLASDDARMCTGHSYFVDAGWR
jgi:D-xylose 1-dehydrogenase